MGGSMSKKVLSSMKSQMVDTLELPKDIVYGSVILNVTGRSEMLVENYKGILEYTQEVIRLQTKTCQLQIEGRGLKISYYTSDEMQIIGVISAIIYLS